MANHKRKKSKRTVRNAMDKESWFGNAKGRFKNKETDKRKKTKQALKEEPVWDWED